MRQGPLRALRPRLRPTEKPTATLLAHRRSDMWRYFETMPVLDEANIVSLGEGMTPILEAPHLAETIGATNLVIKDEGQEPYRHLQIAWPLSRRLQGEGAWAP